MITAVHTLALRRGRRRGPGFFRDILGWPHVDAHDGWLIFKTGPSELGVHPASGHNASNGGTHHEISLMCDDIEEAVAELEAKGARFRPGIEDRGFGRVALFEVPGAGEMMLYEPRHPVAYSL